MNRLRHHHRLDVNELASRLGDLWIEIHGENVPVRLSPYDIPEAITVSDENGIRVVRLQYIADEATNRVESRHTGVVLLIGVDTKRFYGAELATGLLKNRHQYVEKILDALHHQSSVPNYGAAELVLWDAEPWIEIGNTGEYPRITPTATK